MDAVGALAGRGPKLREGPTGVVVGGVVVGGVGGGGGVPCRPLIPATARTATPSANATVDRMQVRTMIRQGSLEPTVNQNVGRAFRPGKVLA